MPGSAEKEEGAPSPLSTTLVLPKGPEAALLLPGLPAPDPGNFLYAQKVTKKAPGDPDPSFCPIGLDQICCCLATEILFFSI